MLLECIVIVILLLLIAYFVFFINIYELVSFIVRGVVEKVILDTVGEKDYKMWLNSIKLLLPQIR